MKKLNGRVAIVTGAASGIGAATAAALAAVGASVIVADLSADAAATHAQTLCTAGGCARAFACDIGNDESVRNLIDFAVKEFGRLDILHNNAAATHLAATRDSPVESADPAVWDDTFRINVRGPMLAAKYAIPPMRERGGAIINTVSNSALVGDLSHTAYAVSKAALIALTQAIATQHGKEGIRCNAISPGLIVTPATASTYAAGAMRDMMLSHHLTPRLGTPDDIAQAVVFLVSDEAAFITGQVLCVDGGMLAHQPYYADLLAMRKGSHPSAESSS